MRIQWARQAGGFSSRSVVGVTSPLVLRHAKAGAPDYPSPAPRPLSRLPQLAWGRGGRAVSLSNG